MKVVGTKETMSNNQSSAQQRAKAMKANLQRDRAARFGALKEPGELRLDGSLKQRKEPHLAGPQLLESRRSRETRRKYTKAEREAYQQMRKMESEVRKAGFTENQKRKNHPLPRTEAVALKAELKDLHDRKRDGEWLNRKEFRKLKALSKKHAAPQQKKTFDKQQRIWRRRQLHTQSKLPAVKGPGDYHFVGKEKKEKKRGWWDTIVDGIKPISEIAKMAIPFCMGVGDYKMAPEVESNSIVAAATEGTMSNQVPEMIDKKASNIIRHREYLGDLLSTTEPFVNMTFDLNPGVKKTFPWLSFIANNYEQWKALGILVEIVTEASDYTDAVGLGFVCMATQYNTQSEPFTDKTSMLNHDMAVSSKPSVNLVHPIECKPSENVLDELYTRAGEEPAGSDKRFYDLGRLNIAVGGQTADDVKIGEVWITYDMAFLTPKAQFASGVSIGFEGYNISSVSGLVPLGANGISKMPNSNLETTLTQGTSTPNIRFKDGTRGRYILSYMIVGSSQTIVSPVLTTTNMEPVNTFFQADNSPYFNTPGGLTTTVYFIHFAFDIFEDGAQFTMGIAGTLPTSASGDVIITQIPQTVNYPTKGFHHVLDERDPPEPVYPKSDIERILEKMSEMMQQKYSRVEDTGEEDLTPSEEEEMERWITEKVKVTGCRKIMEDLNKTIDSNPIDFPDAQPMTNKTNK